MGSDHRNHWKTRSGSPHGTNCSRKFVDAMSRLPMHMKSCGEAFAGSAHIPGAAPHERPMKSPIGHAVSRQVDPADRGCLAWVGGIRVE